MVRPSSAHLLALTFSKAWHVPAVYAVLLVVVSVVVANPFFPLTVLLLFLALTPKLVVPGLVGGSRIPVKAFLVAAGATIAAIVLSTVIAILGASIFTNEDQLAVLLIAVSIPVNAAIGAIIALAMKPILASYLRRPVVQPKGWGANTAGWCALISAILSLLVAILIVTRLQFSLPLAVSDFLGSILGSLSTGFALAFACVSHAYFERPEWQKQISGS